MATRWTWSDALPRLAVLGAVGGFYYAPLAVLGAAHGESAREAALRVAEIRLWLTLLATGVAVFCVISTQLVVVSCLHAALHVAQAMLVIPLRTSCEAWCWHDHALATCVYEYGSLVTFFLILRYVVVPPPSALSNLRWQSRRLKRFFKLHDPKYVSLVDRLLDDYIGNERLLFARVRKIYRTKNAPSPLQTQ